MDPIPMAAALAVTDEVALPIRAVGDLAAAADVSREEVAVITQCEALGGLFFLPPPPRLLLQWRCVTAVAGH